MGAHSAGGQGSARTVTAAAGLAAALVTSAATGLLTGGTAFATDGWDAHGSGHSHGHGHGSGSGWDSDGTSDADRGVASQTWCDALGDVDLGDDYSCDGSSDASEDDDATSSHAAATTSHAAATTRPAATTSPASAPAPRPASSVPDHPTVQAIVAPPSGRKVVPISSRM